MFSDMGGFCSICAPGSWTRRQVEAFAREEKSPQVGRCRFIDKGSIRRRPVDTKSLSPRP